MVPVYVKGGMWTNVEDEILKAAIAKYGLNQWSRVSSLLTRKNAKQCKLRWQEWLDPRIRKSDWSPEEDKRLLNLAKLRPNQWSSISLLLNRTANQCIERYQELLIDYTGNSVGVIDENDKTSRLLLTGNAESSGNKTAGSSLGGLNLNPESKPARADLEEMDEDEKEMISEARARLANTQGKKAKRKAREKILEESRRVADLLRRRELKQVGINATLKNKKKFKDQMDYNADIAFERRPQEGRFDTSKELQVNLKEKRVFDKTTQVKGTFNQEVEAQKRKEKRRREQNKKLTNRQTSKDNTEINLTEEEEDETAYEKEFSKRRKLVFTDIDSASKDNFDQLLGKTVDDLKETKQKKSILLSARKRNTEDENESLPNVVSKTEEKVEKKRKKMERKKVLDLLSSLPEAEDDFDLDIDGMLDEYDNEATNTETVTVVKNKSKLPQVIVDKTEERRIEKKRLNELQEQLQDLETPHAIKNKLPIPQIPSTFPVSTNEIETEMIELIQGKSKSFDIENTSINDLEQTFLIWSNINQKIDNEAQELMKSGKYAFILDSTEFSPYNKNTLLSMIKQYTEKSVEMENKISSVSIKKREELEIDKTIEKIDTLKDELQKVEAELWAYSQFEHMESESMQIRKDRLQRELDYVNQLIESQRQAMFSK